MPSSFRPRQNPVLANWDYLYKHPTAAEQQLEYAVAQLGVPYRFQHIVWKYILDFALPQQMIAIECDGKDHKRADKIAKDAERTAWLEKHGWRVIRLDDDDILRDSHGALARALGLQHITNQPLLN